MTNEEFNKKLEQGNKRMAIVSMTWSAFFAIPVLFTPLRYLDITIISWMVMTIIGILLSSKIVTKLWK